MTAGTSLSEAALGRPSLLQAAVCYPGTSTDTPAHGTQHPPPVYPAPGTQSPPQRTASHSTGTPLSLPRALPAPSTSNLSPPRAQPAHSTSTSTGTRHPAPAPSTSNLSPPRAQPAHSTSTSTGTRHPAPSTQHQQPLKLHSVDHFDLKSAFCRQFLPLKLSPVTLL